MEEKGFEFKNVFNQYFAAFAAYLIMLGHGCIMGWLSPSLPKLLSDETPLDTGPLSDEELSWLGSINNLGALGGILTFGFITTQIGCKRAMLYLALPSIAFWLLIFFGTTYYHLLIARFFTGWTGGGIQTTIVLYVSEISNDSIRGRLGSVMTTSRNVGVLIMFITGAIVDYRDVPCIFIFFPIVFVICFTFMPNTPQYHLHKGEIQKAENVLKFYKGYKGKSDLEINAFNAEFDRLKLLAKQRKNNGKVSIKDFLDRKAISAISCSIFLSWWVLFPGCLTFINYGVLIFERIGASDIDPYTSSIMLAVAQIFGCIFSGSLADSLGRKLLMIMSFLGSAVGLLTLSVYLYLSQIGYNLSSYMWLPVASLSFVMFIASAGVNTICVVCFVEYLPTKIRTIGLTICVISMYSSAFVFIKLFPVTLEMIDLSGCTAVYTIGCVIGAFFVMFALEETKGKYLDTIDENN